MRLLPAVALSLIVLAPAGGFAAGDSAPCISCHKRQRIAAASLRMWEDSAHAAAGVGCVECHRAGADESILSLCPSPGVRRSVDVATCGACHREQMLEFATSRHARAWEPVTTARLQAGDALASPTTVAPCETCHRIGENGGRCDYCHTRHLFDPAQARRPESCRQCHHGNDHPEWDTFFLSRHGTIYATKGGQWPWNLPLGRLFGGDHTGNESLPSAPVCAACHMPRGTHATFSPGGPQLLELAVGDDWAADQRTIRQRFFPAAPGERRPPAAATSSPTPVAYEFDDVLTTCSDCHTRSYVASYLGRARDSVREADRLVATAVRLVDGLNRRGLVPRPVAIPTSADTLGLLDPGSTVERRLWTMTLVHRHDLLLGILHQSPDIESSRGWNELRTDLDEIRAEARSLEASERAR